MFFLNMFLNHGKLGARIIKSTILFSFYTNRLDKTIFGEMSFKKPISELERVKEYEFIYSVSTKEIILL